MERGGAGGREGSWLVSRPLLQPTSDIIRPEASVSNRVLVGKHLGGHKSACTHQCSCANCKNTADNACDRKTAFHIRCLGVASGSGDGRVTAFTLHYSVTCGSHELHLNTISRRLNTHLTQIRNASAVPSLLLHTFTLASPFIPLYSLHPRLAKNNRFRHAPVCITRRVPIDTALVCGRSVLNMASASVAHGARMRLADGKFSGTIMKKSAQRTATIVNTNSNERDDVTK